MRVGTGSSVWHFTRPCSHLVYFVPAKRETGVKSLSVGRGLTEAVIFLRKSRKTFYTT